MDGPDPSRRADSSDSAKRTWGLVSCERGAAKRVKMRDLEDVIQSEGIRMSKFESTPGRQHTTDQEISQIEEPTSSMVSGRLEQDAVCQRLESLDHGGTAQSSENRACDEPGENKEDIDKVCVFIDSDKENDPETLLSENIDTGLGTPEASSTVGLNPFDPHRELVAKPADASECGSTTGPMEIKDPLKIWNMMKQNGFLSYSESHGGIPIPKPRKPRKRKENVLKKKAEPQKRMHVSAFSKKAPIPKPAPASKPAPISKPLPYSKPAPPSGLLSGLDPGIIRHVRNSKQVYSIIEAMMRLEKQDDLIQYRFSSQPGGGGVKETDDRSKGQRLALDSVKKEVERPSVPINFFQGSKFNELEVAKSRVHNETSATSQFASEDDDDEDEDSDTLACNPSSDVAMHSNNATSVSGGDLSGKQENAASLSLKAATVASQWLDLLQHDIRNRLVALRRSKKRVRNVVHTEFPYLLSTELSANKENEPRAGNFSGTWCSGAHTHMTRWSSLFSQMDSGLYDEAKSLENWSKEIHEMQLHCDKGLKLVNPLTPMISADASRKASKPDESECAVMAAAASIYSTSNLAMTKEKMAVFLSSQTAGL